MHQRRYHILVADENDVSLKNAVSLLKRRDYVVAGAPTPDEARWWLGGWPIDLIIASATFGSRSGLQLVLSARSSQPEVAGVIIGAGPDLPDETEARRHGVYVVHRGVNPEELLTRVAECLEGMTRRQRWPRKEVTTRVPMRIGTITGRLMDVSYGGLKFELADGAYVLRSPIEIDFPRAALRLRAEVVWSARRANGRACVFGAAVAANPTPATDWRAFVDRLG